MMNESNVRFLMTRRVRWRDTDDSGYVHFANYVRYMEETEYGFLRSVGLSVVLSDERGKIGFPRRSTSFQIDNPARFDDELKIGLTLREMDGVSLQYDFEIDCNSARVATGSFLVVCCRFPPGKPPYAILIPEFVMDRMSKYQ